MYLSSGRFNSVKLWRYADGDTVAGPMADPHRALRTHPLTPASEDAVAGLQGRPSSCAVEVGGVESDTNRSLPSRRGVALIVRSPSRSCGCCTWSLPTSAVGPHRAQHRPSPDSEATTCRRSERSALIKPPRQVPPRRGSPGRPAATASCPSAPASWCCPLSRLLVGARVVWG